MDDDTWHRVFAWLPVRTDEGRRWLCHVERRRVDEYDYLWREPTVDWVYRVIPQF